MLAKRVFTVFSCLLAVLVSASAMPQTNSSCYPDPPKLLSGNIDLAVDEVVKRGKGDAINSYVDDLVLYTIADALGGDAAKTVRAIDNLRFTAELLRTDTQVGATSTSSGSTAAFEKPGLADLLGFAIERGAIQQQVNSTSVTLSTSPYAFIALVKGDTPTTYQNAEVLNRIGFSATFLLNNKDDILANISRKQLTEWSARVRLSGDRSTRSAGFHAQWDEKVRPLVKAYLAVWGEMANKIFNLTSSNNAQETLLTNVRKNVVTPLNAKIDQYVNDHKADVTSGSPAARAEIKEMILCSLRSVVYQPVRNGEIKVDAPMLIAGLEQMSTLRAKIVEARIKLRAFLKDFAKSGTLSTFAYTNHRVDGGSDYSEFKLLFERHVKPLDVVANAGFSIYNEPNPMLNQDKLRDFMFSFSLQGSSRNPLFRGDPDLATPITYTATGRYQRLMENEKMMTRQPDIANFQARIEIPITPGLSIPVSYTYASATETMAKRENRFNIGLHLDINKVLSSVRLSSAQ